MSDLTDRLRGLYVANGTNYVQEAADEIDRLRVTNKMLMDDKAALRETQAKFGQVQHDLLSQIDALREQLALAESVRAAQVAGLTEGLEALRKNSERYLYLREECPWTMTVDGDDASIGTVSLHIKVSKDMIVAEGEDSFDAAIDAALKGET